MPPTIEKIPVADALKLRFQHGLSYADIAARYHVSPQAVTEKLKKYQTIVEQKESIDIYTDYRPFFFKAGQLKILNSLLSLSPSEQKDLMLRQPGAMGLWFNSLFNNERLETGQSTQNVAIAQSLDIVQTRSRGGKPARIRDSGISKGILSLTTRDNQGDNVSV